MIKSYNLIERIQKSVDGRKARKLVVDGVEYSIDELIRRGIKYAKWFHSEGLIYGCVIGVWLPNSLDWLAILLGAEQVGARIVAINTYYRASELAYICQKVEIECLITQTEFHDVDCIDVLNNAGVERQNSLRLLAFKGGNPRGIKIGAHQTLRYLDVELQKQCKLDAHINDKIIDNAPLLAFTTSGTTSGPKLVLHSSYNLARHAEDVARYENMTERSNVLVVLPLCGVFGLIPSLAALVGGARLVLRSEFVASEYAVLTGRYSITHSYGSDEMFEMALEADEADTRSWETVQRWGFGSLRSDPTKFGSAAGKVGIRAVGLYGSSELLALFALQNQRLSLEERVRPGGHAVAGADVSIRVAKYDLSEDDAEGKVGLLEIKSPTCFIEYWGDKEKTRNAFTKDGFFRTGDMGYLRGDGSFVYVARGDDAIRVGGFLFSPSEVEAIIEQLDFVCEARVVSIKLDSRYRVVAFVRLKSELENFNPSAVIEYVAGRLANYKVPARVYRIDEMPVTKSANGIKVQLGVLRELAKRYINH